MTRMVENAGTMSWEWLEGRTVADGQADAARAYVHRVAVDGLWAYRPWSWFARREAEER